MHIRNPSILLGTFVRRSIACLTLCLGLSTVLLLMPASAEDIGPFYIKHWSSGMYIHPERGRGKVDVTAVVHSGKGAHTQFFFRRVQGEWGHIIHVQSGLILIPYGGRPSSGNNTRIVFHRDPSPGSYFSIDQEKQGIKHYSGRYWHPRGGDTRPDNNTGVVVHDGHGMGTRFYAVDIRTDRALASFMPRKPPVRAGKTTGYWVKACAGGHSCTRKLSNSLQIMNSNEKTLTREERNSIGVSISAGVEFPGGSAGSEVTTSKEVATSEAKTIARSQDVGVGEECEQPVDFEKYQIFALWQWVLSTSVGRREIQMKTCHITCTPDGNRPTYAPGSQKDIKSCWISRAASAPRADEIGVGMIPGTYRHRPVQNKWHVGAITQVGGALRWTNQAGVSWSLSPDLANRRLLTGQDNPYYKQGLRQFDLVIQNGRVVGFRFAGGTYHRE